MRRWTAPLVLAAAVLAALLAMEARTPYYFLQDDNRAQYLPQFVHAYEALAKGEVALYDFHQFLGTPQLATGQGGTLYPPMYLALALSRLLFGHLQAGVDVLAVLHLVGAALAVYLLARTLGLSEAPSGFAGLSWALCSFVVYVGDSWIVYTGFAVWFPLMLAAALRLLRRPGPGPLALLVAARTLLFLEGHPQNFLYSVLFEGLALAFAIAAGSEDDAPAAAVRTRLLHRFLPRYLLSFALTAAFSAPLLFPMLAQTAASESRSAALPISVYLSGLAAPDRILDGLLDPTGPGTSLNDPRYFSFIGRPGILLAVLAAATGALGQTLRFSPHAPPPGAPLHDAAQDRLRRLLLVALPPAALAFLWATDAGFNRLLYAVPVLNRFRWPFKLTAFFLLFLSLVGAAGLQVLQDRLATAQAAADGREAEGTSPRRRLRRAAATGLVLVLLALQFLDLSRLYLVHPRKTLKDQREEIPLSEPWATTIGQERVASVGFRADTDRTALTLGYDYATLFGLYHFAGYEPLLLEDNAKATHGYNYDAMINRGAGPTASIGSIGHFRAWGVRWYVAPAGEPAGTLAELAAVATDGERTLYRDDAARPMAYAEEGAAASTDGVILSIGVNGLEVRTDRAADARIVVCFLRNPSFTLTVDGVPQALDRDRYGRIAFDVPAGAHVARIVYKDTLFERGLAVFGLAAFATGIGALLARRLRRGR